MIAYQNSRGHVLAVFKDDSGEYRIYERKDKRCYFKQFRPEFPTRKTRAEAELDLYNYVSQNVKDKSWQKINFVG
jgi:hypothetical protein